MKRSILLALVAALALAVGFNAAASASIGAGAEATAKKKAGKKKGTCKAKGKKKAGKSAVDGSAAAKKKGKKKASGCKAKPKKGKGKPKSPKGATLGDGTYEDAAKNVEIVVSGKGTKVLLRPPGSKCLAGIPVQLMGALVQKGTTYTATKTDTIGGSAGTVKWTLTVQAGLTYKLDMVWDIAFPDMNPCHDEMTVKGTLTKK